MKHTGFIAYQEDGVVIRERNMFLDDSLGKECATNWHHVDKSQLSILELWWQGKLAYRLIKNHPSQQWLFYHTACHDKSGLRIISRNIGLTSPSGKLLVSVDETTGYTQLI